MSKFAKGEGALKVGVKCKSRLNSNCNLCCYGEILPQMDNFLSLSLIGRKFLKLRMKLNSQASLIFLIKLISINGEGGRGTLML